MSATFDDRSEKNLKSLLPAAERAMRELLGGVLAVLPPGVTAKVISGTRTYAEQQELYDKGRKTPGPKVTNARPGFSWHNFGLAVDLGLFSGVAYIPESPLYDRIGAVAEALGLEWGGSWTGPLADKPHVQVRTGLTLAEMRARARAGVPLLPEPPVAWRVVVGGKQIAQASIVGGSAVAPVRAIAEALGASVAADSATRRITLTPKG